MIVLSVVLGAAPAPAQFTQYIAPGTLGNEPQDLEERLDEGARSARYRLGQLRVDPVIFVRDVGYQSNVFGAADNDRQVDDYRLLVAAGLNGYLPLGDKAMLSAFVTPEYSWWADNEDLRQFNLSVGAGVFGFFNRLTVTADGRRLKQESQLNAEVPTPITLEEDRLSLGVELEVYRSLFVFAGLRDSEYRHSDAARSAVDEIELLALDRDYESERLGLRVGLGGAWSLGGGVEESRNDFLFDPGSRSNEGSGPFGEIRYESERLSGQVAIHDLDLDFAADSPLSGFSSNTGTGRVTYRTPQELSLALYGSRNVVFSVRETDSLFVEQRLGLSAGKRFRRRLSWLAFVENGDLEYSGTETDGRVDDVTAFGLNLGYDLTGLVTVLLAYEQTDYESSLPEFDRGVSTFGLRLAFRDNLFPF